MDTDDLALVARARVLCQSGAARAIREAAGVSVGEVARSVGVARATVFRWERSQRRPRGIAAVRYATTLGALLEAAS